MRAVVQEYELKVVDSFYTEPMFADQLLPHIQQIYFFVITFFLFQLVDVLINMAIQSGLVVV